MVHIYAKVGDKWGSERSSIVDASTMEVTIIAKARRTKVRYDHSAFGKVIVLHLDLLMK